MTQHKTMEEAKERTRYLRELAEPFFTQTQCDGLHEMIAAAYINGQVDALTERTFEEVRDLLLKAGV